MAIFSTTLGNMEGLSEEAAIKKMANHLRQMQEELEYRLANLDGDNFNETGMKEITAPVYAQIGDVEGEVTKLKLDMNGLSLVVTNGDQSSTVQLKSGEIVLSSGTIQLRGMVTFADLAGNGTTVINGANIQTGSISADFISGGTLEGVAIKSQDETQGYIKIQNGYIDLYDDRGYPAGSFHYDDMEDKVYLFGNSTLKIESGWNMSIAGGGAIYLSAPEINIGSGYGGQTINLNGNVRVNGVEI